MTPEDDAPAAALVPAERLVIEWPAGTPFNADTEDAFNAAALDQILAKAAELAERGERPWMEVWYRGVPGRADSTDDDFDAVEVDGEGNIGTLPPYDVLRGEA